uniref:Cytochrome P450 n=1 Tax=Leersia perrieri TaxID=77586 RepID=A0A0D9X4S8_9ORYZ
MENTSNLISWLPIAAIATSLVYYFIFLNDRRRPLPPGPPPLPLIGNLHNLAGGGVLHHTLMRLARRHGAVMSLKLGLTTTIVISSRDAVREAFTSHDRRLAARPVPDALRAVGFSDRSMIFLASSDPRWKSMRAIHATRVLSRRGARPSAARAGTVVDVERVVYGGVLNLLSSAFFSVDVVDDVAAGGDQPARNGGGGLPELLPPPEAAIDEGDVARPPYLHAAWK